MGTISDKAASLLLLMISAEISKDDGDKLPLLLLLHFLPFRASFMGYKSTEGRCWIEASSGRWTIDFFLRESNIGWGSKVALLGNAHSSWLR